MLRKQCNIGDCSIRDGACCINSVVVKKIIQKLMYNIYKEPSVGKVT
jgi:hypothetical protein